MSEIDEETRALYERAIDKWGYRSQLDQTQEECGELIVEVSHEKRGRGNFRKMMGEVADVEIMCEQMRVMYGHDMIDEIKKQKLARLKARLDEVENV